MLYGIKGARLNIKNMLTICGLLCIACYLTVVFSPWPMLSLLACGICGLSVSLMWPGTLVIAADALPSAGTALFALMAMGGDIGCSAGPWLTGFVSDAAAESQWLLDKTGMEAEQVGPARRPFSSDCLSRDAGNFSPAHRPEKKRNLRFYNLERKLGFFPFNLVYCW